MPPQGCSSRRDIAARAGLAAMAAAMTEASDRTLARRFMAFGTNPKPAPGAFARTHTATWRVPPIEIADRISRQLSLLVSSNRASLQLYVDDNGPGWCRESQIRCKR